MSDRNINVKNIKKFPYCAIGIISVQYPVSDEVFKYTCFLIDTNIVVTLAANLENKNQGGRAKSIVTSFSKENVKWENIFIQDQERTKENNNKKEDKNKNELLDNFPSKLAVIIYNYNFNNEWLGVDYGKKEDFEGKDIIAVFSFKEDNKIITFQGEEKTSQPKFKEICVYNVNPFLEASKKGEEEEEELDLIKQSPGSPLIYKDYNGGAYVIAIITENFEFQYFDKKTMIFLVNMVKKGKLFRKKINKDIDEENIINLSLEGYYLGPSDIKFLTEFNLLHLRFLDLNNNLIRSKGAFYLSQNKFISLESLNLSNNKIGDEGLNHIANGSFSKLKILHLSYNYITSEGIKYLVKAKFIYQLIILSLSDNMKIGDNGISYIKEIKGWGKLVNTLNLNNIGLTDIGLDYMAKINMPKLKRLNIWGNKFTKSGKSIIEDLRKNFIIVNYEAEDKLE